MLQLTPQAFNRPLPPTSSEPQAMMTLRQVEVVRAVMVTGTIGGAAKLRAMDVPVRTLMTFEGH